jgi:hypothetical protein
MPAKSRLKRRPDGRVVPQLKRAWSDGTPDFVCTPSVRVAHMTSRVTINQYFKPTLRIQKS